MSISKDQIEIQFNDKVIIAQVGNRMEWEIEWAQIERIGYRTNAADLWASDYFLVLRTRDKPPIYYEIPLEWKGAQKLAEYIDNLSDTKIPAQGKLANSTKEANVTIWPSEFSGLPI